MGNPVHNYKTYLVMYVDVPLFFKIKFRLLIFMIFFVSRYESDTLFWGYRSASLGPIALTCKFSVCAAVAVLIIQGVH